MNAPEGLKLQKKPKKVVHTVDDIEEPKIKLQKNKKQVDQEKELPQPEKKQKKKAKGKAFTQDDYYVKDIQGLSVTTFTRKRLQKKKPIYPESKCKCLKIEGHLEAVKWMLWPREYMPSLGPLQIEDWTDHPFIWMHYVQRSDGTLPNDAVFLSENSGYWDIDGVQRYFIGRYHCEDALFLYQYPNLKLPTHHGRHLWKLNAASKKHSPTYMKEFGISIEVTLKKIEITQQQIDRLAVSDQLIRIGSLDKFKRETFFRLLLKVLCIQENLQFVSFENLCCQRLEGVRLIQQLACFNAETLKYLFLWRFVDPYENPLLINYSYTKGSGKYIPRPNTKQCFLRSLGELRNLRVLALEYAHIADDKGAALIGLLPLMKRPKFRLHLMCRSTHVPGRNDPLLGCGGLAIPDTTWRRVQFVCPYLYLSMVFFRIREYDDLRRFLTPSIPLNDIHLDMGIDLYKKQRQDSDLSCFVRHVAYRYRSFLVTLSIHQWRFATFPLDRILEMIPGLVRFFYIGRVESEVDLKKVLNIIASGVCLNLKQVKIKVQDDFKNRDYWRACIEHLNEEYSEVLKLYDFQLRLDVYKS